MTRHPATRRAPGDTRNAILAAAAAEFAAHGFAGASVDAIAARSRFNKAMIYYHFEGKQGLYAEILRDVFRGLGARTADIAGSDVPAPAKIDAFIDAFNEMADTHPYMPPIMMREMAEGAVRLDRDTLKLMGRVFDNLRTILESGAAAGAFQPANPLLTYFTLVSPVIFFHASRPVREALGRQQVVDLKQVETAHFVAHLKGVVRTVLAPNAGTEAGATMKKRGARATRTGDHA